jgi:CheY-like chemotaxis protein
LPDLTVLVAEDDAPIRTLIATVLQRDGFGVEAVHDGKRAIEQLEKRDFDVIVLDLMMSGASGYGVLNHLHAHKPHLLKQVIVITAAHGTILRSLDRYGIHALVKKPFDLHEFRNLVKETGRQGVVELSEGGIVAITDEPNQSCSPTDHRWRETERAPSEVLDIVNEVCENCGTQRTLYIPHTPSSETE